MKPSWEYKPGTKHFKKALKYAEDMCKAREEAI